jgi:hypothetical protein
MRLDRTDKRIASPSALFQAFGLPCFQIGERRRIPPQGHNAWTVALGNLAAETQVRSLNLDDDVIELQASDFGDTQPAAAGQAHDDAIASVVNRAAGANFQVGQNGGKLAAAQ